MILSAVQSGTAGWQWQLQKLSWMGFVVFLKVILQYCIENGLKKPTRTVHFQ